VPVTARNHTDRIDSSSLSS